MIMPKTDERAIPLRILGLAILLALPPAVSSHASPGEEKKLRAAAEAVGREVGDHVLMDQDGRAFHFSEYCGKPVVVSFLYTRCGHICPTITQNLRAVIKTAGSAFGAKFHVLTLSFDTENDTPEVLNAYGRKFGADFRYWRFATADRTAMEEIIGNLGFSYERASGGFDHLNMVTVVDKGGRVYRQVYGMNFKPEEVLAAIDHSLAGIRPGKTPDVLDKIKLFCLSYDPITGEYRPDYGMFTRLFLIMAVQLALVFIGVYLYKSAKEVDKRQVVRREVERESETFVSSEPLAKVMRG